MSYYANQRIKEILDQIQDLHAEARELADMYSIPFEIGLQRADGYTTYHHFNPSNSGWDSSNC